MWSTLAFLEADRSLRVVRMNACVVPLGLQVEYIPCSFRSRLKSSLEGIAKHSCSKDSKSGLVCSTFVQPAIDVRPDIKQVESLDLDLSAVTLLDCQSTMYGIERSYRTFSVGSTRMSLGT